MKNINLDRKSRRKIRISSTIHGTADKPRVSVFRSNRFIYAQAIDDINRKTIASFSSLILKKDKDYKKMKKSEEAKEIGKQLAKILIEKKIDKAVFDRNVYTYLGRVKSLCDGLRDGGIKI